MFSGVFEGFGCLNLKKGQNELQVYSDIDSSENSNLV